MTAHSTRLDDAGPDLGIRYGPGQWPGLVSRFLMDDSLLPLAAPTLAGLRDVREPKHIARLRLISDLVPESWREWFRAAKVRNVRLAPTHIISDSSNSLDAAAAGLGADSRRASGSPPGLSGRRAPDPARVPSCQRVMATTTCTERIDH